MLYIDNPVGTGFSFTNSSDGLSTTEDEVADNLYKYLEAISKFLLIFCPFSFSLFFLLPLPLSLLSALIQFFLVFPEYLKNPFYITGEVSVYVHVYLCIMWCVCDHVKNFLLIFMFFCCMLFVFALYAWLLS